MKATEFLKQQHQEVRDLFKKIERASDRASKAELFESLATKLVGHDAIERQIFYPACEENMGMTSELGEALVEHGLVEFCLYQADQAIRAKDSEDHEFDYKCKVLEEIVEHHVKEEEQEFFPKVEKAFDGEQLDELTDELEELFADNLESNFRVALYANLQQVLAGVVKTSPVEDEDEDEDDESSEETAEAKSPQTGATRTKSAPATASTSKKKPARRSA